MSLSVTNFSRHPLPRLPFVSVAREVLPSWDISLVLLPPDKARALNKKLRRKSYTPNVLSYEAGERSGEILLCPSVAKKQAPLYGLSYKDFLLLLFIHALLHLKGMPHGSTMEKREQALLTKFRSADTRIYYGSSHRNRNRRRHLPGEDRRHRRNRG